MSSDDLEHWRFEGRVLEQTPQWALDKGFSGMPWAPDVQYYNGQYYVYYSYSLFGRNVSAIGVATNRTLDPRSPEYRWTDHGMIVESIPGRDEWNAIDANVIVDEDGTGWLCFGSFWRGIKMFRLDGSLLRIAEPQEWYPLCRRPEGTAKAVSGTDDGIAHDPRGKDFDPGDGAVEAPFIFRHDGWYYLFVSYDLSAGERPAPTRSWWEGPGRLRDPTSTGTGSRCLKVLARSSCRETGAIPESATVRW